MKPDWLLSPHSCPGFLRHEVVSRVVRQEHIHHTEHLFVKIPQRYALVNIQDLVEAALQRAEIQDGLCFVSAMHITAGIYVNDAEDGLLRDISRWISELGSRSSMRSSTGDVKNEFLSK